MIQLLVTGFCFALLAARDTRAEQHIIRFKNNCGFGTPNLLTGGQIVFSGEGDYTSDGPFVAGIAYLQNGGACGFNGENCTTMEMTLGDGMISSTDISLIAPHQYSVATSFSYFNGCDGLGRVCNVPNCNTAFFQPDDNWVQVQCETSGVGLLITFCEEGESPSPTTSTPGAGPQTDSAPATIAQSTATSTSKTALPSPTTSANDVAADPPPPSSPAASSPSPSLTLVPSSTSSFPIASSSPGANGARLNPVKSCQGGSGAARLKRNAAAHRRHRANHF